MLAIIAICNLNISLQGLLYIDFPKVSIAHTALIIHDATLISAPHHFEFI